MPKNKKGGSGHKKMANKHGEVRTKELVVSRDQDEIYAVVVKNYGNGRSEVRCNDGKTRMLFIPRRFRGRNRHDNMVNPGTIILVGIRSWEVRPPNKMEKCDLLYVYDENEVIRLKKNKVPIYWKLLHGEQDCPELDDLGFTMEDHDDVAFDFDTI